MSEVVFNKADTGESKEVSESMNTIFKLVVAISGVLILRYIMYIKAI